MNSISTECYANTGLLLNEPLLGDLSNKGVEADVVDKNHRHEHRPPTILHSVWDYVCTLLVLPGLLTAQFMVAFRNDTAHDDVSSVDGTIFLFVLMSYLYKLSIAEHILDNVPVLIQQVAALLPEILMDIVLGTVLCVHAKAGMVVLLLSTIALAVGVILLSSYSLAMGEYDNNKDEEEDEDNSNNNDNVMDVSERDGCLRFSV